MRMREHHVLFRRVPQFRSKPRRPKRLRVIGRNDQVVGPLEKFRTRFRLHALRQPGGKAIFGEKRIDQTRDERLRVVGQRPVEIFRGLQHGQGLPLPVS